MKRSLKEAHIYFPANVMTGIKKMAAANRRSISAEVIIAVEDKLRTWEATGNGVQRRNKRDWPLCATCKVGVTSADAEAGRCTNCGSALKVVQ